MLINQSWFWGTHQSPASHLHSYQLFLSASSLHPQSKGRLKRCHYFIFLDMISISSWCKFLTDMCHEMLELTGGDGPTPILIQCPERQLDHLLVLGVAHLVRHHLAELRKLYLSRTISIILRSLDYKSSMKNLSNSCFSPYNDPFSGFRPPEWGT